ncbi:MAG: hypothetical protein ACXU8N_10085 [Telluria sp.]
MVTGTAAAVLSAAALAALGRRDSGSAIAPVNAVSHWLWGDQAARREDVSAKYTATGYAIHHASSIFWGVLFERAFGQLLDRRRPAQVLAAAAATTAVACVTDYKLTPRRLQPGFEKRLAIPSVALVYAAFGLGLAGAALALRHGR